MKIYTTSREDYLKAILRLYHKNPEVHSVDVARYLGFSKPSVCHAVALLSSEGYLEMDDDHVLHLTDKGREIAERTFERHCFFTQQLMKLGVDAKTAQEDACRMEHAISDTSFEKLKAHFAPEGVDLGALDELEEEK